MSRNPEKDMLKSWGSFDTTIKLCLQAFKKGNINRYQRLLETLESTFYKFDEDWRIYKDETIKKSSGTIEAFNANTETEDGGQKAAYFHNEAWSEGQLGRYVDTRELLQEVLDEKSNSGDLVKTDQNVINAEFIVNDIKTDIKTVETTIENLKLDIGGFEDQSMPPTVALGHENLISKLKAQIETDIRGKVLNKLESAAVPADPEYNNLGLQNKFMSFSEKNKAELNSCTILLAKKVAPVIYEPKVAVAAISPEHADIPGHAVYKPQAQIYLEKTKPLKFSGDDLDFPEFKRKWLAQVNKANLPEETELDKLRDALPCDASRGIYSCMISYCLPVALEENSLYPS